MQRGRMLLAGCLALVVLGAIYGARLIREALVRCRRGLRRREADGAHGAKSLHSGARTQGNKSVDIDSRKPARRSRSSKACDSRVCLRGAFRTMKPTRKAGNWCCSSAVFARFPAEALSAGGRRPNGALRKFAGMCQMPSRDLASLLCCQGNGLLGAVYPPDHMRRPTGPTCDGCHSVDYDIRTKQVAEWNVGCERCHGPGSEHAAHPTRGISSIRHRWTMSMPMTRASNAIRRGALFTIPWKANTTIGRLGIVWACIFAIFRRSRSTRLDRPHSPFCGRHRAQEPDARQRFCAKPDVSPWHYVFPCHDAHGTGNYAQPRKPAEQLCLDGHGPLSPNGPARPPSSNTPIKKKWLDRQPSASRATCRRFATTP
jgi:hypothetical protein